MIRKGVHIRGLVQGVWFRKYTHEKASGLGLVGFVKNMPEGSVYAEVEGDEKKVGIFIELCKLGSPQSKVDSISLSDLKLKGESSFEILR